MPTYPLPPHTTIYHIPTGSVYETLDEDGHFLITYDNYGGGGETFHNPSFWDAACANPNPGLVIVIDCPVKERRLADGTLRVR